MMYMKIILTDKLIKMKENNFQTNVKKYLEQNNAYVVNVWGGGYQTAGVPDLLICYKGLFIALELKVDYNKASEIQKWHLEQINKCKGTGLVMRYTKNWKQDLQWLLDNAFNINYNALPSSFEPVARKESITNDMK